ncbi:MAG: glycoside hydrolase family 71/99 protein [Armatimonadota bacterium]
MDKEYLVGVYYFSGWWRSVPNKYITAGRDWRLDYPERVALLGEYNEQETMDREIIAASEHGVDYFQILWYPPCEQDKSYPELNAGVHQFMASPNSGMMRFTVEYVNHPPFAIMDESNWESTCEEWCGWMDHPAYLRVGGKPVFKIHGLSLFLGQCGGDFDLAADRISRFRQIASGQGIHDLLISAGIVIGEQPDSRITDLFDFITTYMDMPNLEQNETPYPYENLIAHAENGWVQYAHDLDVPYVPYLPAGWDPRPWRDPRPSFDFPDRSEWKDALERVKAVLDTEHHLGIPLPDNRRQKTMLIYAWNEFGEGGIVAPVQGDRYMKLEVIKEVFGT